MNVTLSLEPEVERGLKARAEARGVSLNVYLQEVVEREAKTSRRPHIADVIRERMSKVPAEILASLPKDGASQHDHYIYGLPKRSESE
jgi:hypothetical protein